MHTRAGILLSVKLCQQPCFTFDNRTQQRGLAHYAQSAVNHYDVLGLKPTASPSQIKSAYYKLSKKYHPDVADVNVVNAREKFARVSSAYEILGNPDKRAEYDRTLQPSICQPETSRSSNIDVEYREFMRRRGSFQSRTGGQARSSASRTAGQAYPRPRSSANRIRYDYAEFCRQQHFGRTMNEYWEARRQFEQRLRQQHAANMPALWIFLMFAIGLSLGANNSWFHRLPTHTESCLSVNGQKWGNFCWKCRKCSEIKDFTSRNDDRCDVLVSQQICDIFRPYLLLIT